MRRNDDWEDQIAHANRVGVIIVVLLALGLTGIFLQVKCCDQTSVRQDAGAAEQGLP